MAFQPEVRLSIELAEGVTRLARARVAAARNWTLYPREHAAVHPSDPFRPQVKVVLDDRGDRLEEPFPANTWERVRVVNTARAVVEQIDPEPQDIDPLTLL